jgi:predicted TIM-barrel fold metal-dependent hydrolase
MFASNFPVDGMHGSYDELYGAYDVLTSELDPATRDQLFAANAERVYGC